MSTFSQRPNLCRFTFADNRHCRMPLSSSHAYLCTYHARKEAQHLASQRTGRVLSAFLSHNYITACDLTAAMGHLFGAVAQGHIKPGAAHTLAYVGQTIAQTLRLAQHEFISAYGVQAWRAAVRDALLSQPPASSTSMSPRTPPPETISSAGQVAAPVTPLVSAPPELHRST